MNYINCGIKKKKPSGRAEEVPDKMLPTHIFKEPTRQKAQEKCFRVFLGVLSTALSSTSKTVFGIQNKLRSRLRKGEKYSGKVVRSKSGDELTTPRNKKKVHELQRREVVDQWVRDRKWGQKGSQGPDHVGSRQKKFECYFRYDGKSLEDFTQASDLTWFVF